MFIPRLTAKKRPKMAEQMNKEKKYFDDLASKGGNKSVLERITSTPMPSTHPTMKEMKTEVKEKHGGSYAKAMKEDFSEAGKRAKGAATTVARSGAKAATWMREKAMKKLK